MSLLKKFDAHFSIKIAQLLSHGYVKIDKTELLVWYGRDRITDSIWNDFHDAWEALLLETNHKDAETNSLYKKDAGDHYLIINNYSFDPLLQK
jgi:hypothetical protein